MKEPHISARRHLNAPDREDEDAGPPRLFRRHCRRRGLSLDKIVRGQAKERHGVLPWGGGDRTQREERMIARAGIKLLALAATLMWLGASPPPASAANRTAQFHVTGCHT